MTPILTQARVRELFDYDPATGILTRRIKCGSWLAGTAVGTRERTYGTVGIDYKNYALHKVICLWLHGHMPARIKHLDGSPTNNRSGNLRAVESSANNQPDGNSVVI